MEENIIVVEQLCRRYMTFKRGSGFKESLKSFFHREKVPVDAVKDISFTVKKGDIIGILGPNGAGKSTTIKMLTGSLYPSSGSISVMGYTPWKNRTEYVKSIGVVFGQKSQLIFDIPPVDSFLMNKAIYDIPDKEYTQRLDHLIQLLDLGDKVNRPTRVLSLGERMKCEFIMAMLHNPEVVFLDEPTIGLDVIAKQVIREFIRSMNEKGTTFILTTHDLEDVEKLARNVIIINKGQKVFDGTIQDLRTNLGNKKVVELTVVDSNHFANLSIEGVRLLPSEDKHKIMVEVDVDQLPMNQFIRYLSDVGEFRDISIQELPMEDIITTIYQE